jgi:hypothetical protein
MSGGIGSWLSSSGIVFVKSRLRTVLAIVFFAAAYNFARRLKTLRGLTPYEAICKLWTHDPDRFTLDPIHQMPGLNTYLYGLLSEEANSDPVSAFFKSISLTGYMMHQMTTPERFDRMKR